MNYFFTSTGYSVTIAADAGDSRYIDEAVGNGIRVLICENLKHMNAFLHAHSAHTFLFPFSVVLSVILPARTPYAF